MNLHPFAHPREETRRRRSKVYLKTLSQTVRSPAYAHAQLLCIIIVLPGIDDAVDYKVVNWMQLTQSPIRRTNGLKQSYQQEEKGMYVFNV